MLSTITFRRLMIGTASGALLAAAPAIAQTDPAATQAANSAQRAEPEQGLVDTTQPSGERLPRSTASPPSCEYACAPSRMQPSARSRSRSG